MNTPAPQGITRFHKLTISCGVIFCFIVAWRFGTAFLRVNHLAYLLMAIGGLAGGLTLGVYLVRFSRRGI